jgi:glycosyltransferase involved in cell wall biosynthesis
MRILWFVNTPFPEVVEELDLKGHFMGCWMSSLKQALLNMPGFRSVFESQLGVVCVIPDISKPHKFQIDKVTYFCVPKSRMGAYFQSYNKELYHCIRIVNDFNPDIIHVHGTEEFYGLITERINYPVVISIQGILSAVVKVYFGNMKWSEIILSPRIIRHYVTMRRKTKTEKRIFRINQNFIGRTQWDKAQMLNLANGNFMYYHCNEVMNQEFYEKCWSIKESEPWTIACVSSPYAYKGVNSILEAMTFLIKKHPDVILFIYGSFSPFAYGAFLQKKAKKLGLMNHIRFCGFKNPKQLVKELRKARVFVIASHIENSSNSLQEAMLVGIPSVVSYTGGLPSIAEHEKTCLMFPRGDSAVMADCIYEVLSNEKLAVRISEASKKKSRKRNNPKRIGNELLHIYTDVIDKKRKA